VSLGVFTVYYVGLIAGESLANQLVVPAPWAMWTPNIVFGLLGLAGLHHIRGRATTARGRRTLLARMRAKLQTRRSDA
jgi:lipopolysaccharide export system permease protein